MGPGAARCPALVPEMRTSMSSDSGENVGREQGWAVSVDSRVTGCAGGRGTLWAATVSAPIRALGIRGVRVFRGCRSGTASTVNAVLAVLLVTPAVLLMSVAGMTRASPSPITSSVRVVAGEAAARAQISRVRRAATVVVTRVDTVLGVHPMPFSIRIYPTVFSFSRS